MLVVGEETMNPLTWAFHQWLQDILLFVPKICQGLTVAALDQPKGVAAFVAVVQSPAWDARESHIRMTAEEDRILWYARQLWYERALDSYYGNISVNMREQLKRYAPMELMGAPPPRPRRR